jgi:hypothetical protein
VCSSDLTGLEIDRRAHSKGDNLVGIYISRYYLDILK